MTPELDPSLDALYQQHRTTLTLRGLSDKTIDAYARAVRRLLLHFQCCPTQLSTAQLEAYFAQLVASHSWSTVKVERNGLQFFWQFVLKRDWAWLQIIRAPKSSPLPDVLTSDEVARLLAATHHLRFRVFFLTTYSMGLRLSETLALQVGDIDAARKRVHIRRGKGHKDRFVPLPDLTLLALRALWQRHRNPVWLFPSASGGVERARWATSPLDRSSTQAAMKGAVNEVGIKKK